MNRSAWSGFVLVLLVSGAWGQESGLSKASCAVLAKLTLPNTKIMLAEQVEAGAGPPRAPLPGAAPTQIYPQLPAFCRVVAEVAPSADSDIKVEVWMPVSGWNGKFRGQGNGGFAGEIDYGGLALAVSQGYASGGYGHRACGIGNRCILGAGTLADCLSERIALARKRVGLIPGEIPGTLGSK